MKNYFNAKLASVTTLDQLTGGILLDRRNFTFSRNFFTDAMRTIDEELGTILNDSKSYTVIGNALPFCPAYSGKQGLNYYVAFSFAVQPEGSDKVFIISVDDQKYLLTDNPTEVEKLPVFINHHCALISLVNAVVSNLLAPHNQNEHGYKSEDALDQVVETSSAVGGAREAAAALCTLTTKVIRGNLDFFLSTYDNFVPSSIVEDRFRYVAAELYFYECSLRVVHASTELPPTIFDSVSKVLNSIEKVKELEKFFKLNGFHSTKNFIIEAVSGVKFELEVYFEDIDKMVSLATMQHGASPTDFNPIKHGLKDPVKAIISETFSCADMPELVKRQGAIIRTAKTVKQIREVFLDQSEISNVLIAWAQRLNAMRYGTRNPVQETKIKLLCNSQEAAAAKLKGVSYVPIGDREELVDIYIKILERTEVLLQDALNL